MNYKILIISILCLSLTGCKVGPNYQPTQVPVQEDWVIERENEKKEEPKACINIDPAPTLWWQIFDDPLLNQYMEIASFHNNDVLKAEVNIFQARAAREVAIAPLFPQISVDYDAFRVFLSKNGPIDALMRGAPVMGAKPLLGFNIFNAFIDASWELDIFGKTRRSIEAATAALEGTIDQKNDILISVFAEIARNYLELRSLQQQKKLLEENVQLLKKNVEIIEERYTKGYSNLLDLEQINIQLNQTISEIPQVTIGIYQNIFAISVLIGNPPECLLEELLPIKALPALPDCLSVGLRSELLRKRPDVRAAERNLAENVANIGVAIANFYPSFTLTGIFGLQSLHLKNLFSEGSKTWIYGADMHMPFFQGGKLIGNLKISEQEAAASAFTYVQTILTALKEAETAIIAYNEHIKTNEELKRIVKRNEHLKVLNDDRFKKGLTSRLDTINSDLILNNAVLSLLQSETSALLDLVSLYKALGGGWEPFSSLTCDR